jgi:hypothetical protein
MHVTIGIDVWRLTVRPYVSLGAVLVAGALACDVVVAATRQRPDVSDKPSSVDIELVIAVDVSYSMDPDELAVQREGYAQAIVSKEFLQAMKTGPNGKISVTYFEWSAANDQTIIVPWRLIDGPETADSVAKRNHEDTDPQRFAHLDLRSDPVCYAAVR